MLQCRYCMFSSLGMSISCSSPLPRFFLLSLTSFSCPVPQTILSTWLFLPWKCHGAVIFIIKTSATTSRYTCARQRSCQANVCFFTVDGQATNENLIDNAKGWHRKHKNGNHISDESCQAMHIKSAPPMKNIRSNANLPSFMHTCMTDYTKHMLIHVFASICECDSSIFERLLKDLPCEWREAHYHLIASGNSIRESKLSSLMIRQKNPPIVFDTQSEQLSNAK